MSVLLVFTLLSSALAAVPLASVQRTTSTRLVPNRFIVELENVSTFPQAGKRDVSYYGPSERSLCQCFCVLFSGP